jgi:acetyl esterase/lipase
MTSVKPETAATAAAAVVIDAEGTAHIPAFAAPMSRYMSDASQRKLMEQIANPPLWALEPDIGKNRAAWDKHFYTPLLESARALHPTRVRHEEIAGVPVDIVEPATGVAPEYADAVLINLHGGAFTIGAGMGGLIESIPIAALTGITVISVDYRQGPEHRFPAGSEDVAAVYRELLKKYRAQRIGIYGCSAGGLLTAMATAWFQQHDLPAPAAIGVLCAPADDQFDGDSRYVTPPLTGQMPPLPHAHDLGMMAAYLQGADSSDPLVSPIVSPEVLGRFPPTLFLTGTRAGELSSVVHSHARFVAAGVDARLHVWEGMWHGFFYDVQLPESKEALAVIAQFFQRELRAAR